MNELKKYFDAETLNGERPLYQQIRDMLERYICDSESGVILPSERELASFLKVNRRTLRKALSFFVEDGQLQRSARGTVICKVVDDKAVPSPLLKSFLLDNLPVHSFGQNKLSLVIYENLPEQVKFWQRTVEAYNRKNQTKIEIEWITAADFNGGGFFPWYREHQNFDIYLMPPGWQWIGDIKTLPFSNYLRDYMNKSVFRIHEFCGNNSGYADKTAIIGIAFPVSAWNSAMATNCGLTDLSKRFRNGEINDILREATVNLGEEYFLSSNYATIMTDIGVPDNRDPESIKDYFRKKIERVAIAAGRRARGLAISPKLPIEYRNGLNPFISEKCFFIGATYTLLKMFLAEKPIRYEMSPVMPPEGYKIYCSEINMAIGTECRDIGTAEDFLHFMLSNPVQRDLAGLGIAPVRRAALDTMTSFDPSAIDDLVGQTRCLLPDLIGQLLNKVVLHPYYERLLQGRISVDDAVAAAYEDFLGRCSN